MQRILPVLVLICSLGIWSAAWQLLSEVQRTARDEALAASLAEIHSSLQFNFAGEVFRAVNLADDIGEDPVFADMTSLGQGEMLIPWLVNRAKKIPHLSFEVFDFEGDPLADTGPQTFPVIPESLKNRIVSGSKAGIFHVQSRRIWYSYGTWVESPQNSAGFIVLHKNLDSVLSEVAFRLKNVSLYGFSSDRPDFSGVNRYAKELLQSNNIAGTRPVDTLLSLPGKKHHVWILPELEGLSDIRFLATLNTSDILHLQDAVLSDLHAHCALVSMISLILAFLVSGKFGRSVRSLGMPDARAEEARKSFFPLLHAQHLVLSRKTEDLDRHIVRLRNQITVMKNERQKIKELSAIDDISYKLFLESIQHQKLELLKEMQVHADCPEKSAGGIVKKFLMLSHKMQSQARFFQLKQIDTEISGFETHVRDLQRCEVEIGETELNTIFEKMEHVVSELDSYTEIRKSLLGKDSERVQLSEINPWQTAWLKTVINTMGQTLQNPSPDQEHVQKIAWEGADAVSMTGQIDIRDYLRRYTQWARNCVGSTGKVIRDISWKGNHPWLPQKSFVQINDMITQAVKNAVCHGIESAFRRKKLGKPQEGCIGISINQRDQILEITVTDDGKGIAEEDILEIAIREKIIAPEKAKELEPSEVRDLLFHPKFTGSKKDIFRQTQGFGLASVRENARFLGGDCQFVSDEGTGSTLKVSVPAETEYLYDNRSLFSVRVLAAKILRKQAGEGFRSVKLVGVPDHPESDFIFNNRLFFSEVFKKLLWASEGHSDAGPGSIVCSIESHILAGTRMASLRFSRPGDEKKQFLNKIMRSQLMMELVQDINEFEGVSLRPVTGDNELFLDLVNPVPENFRLPEIRIGNFTGHAVHIREFMHRYLEEELPCLTLTETKEKAGTAPLGRSVSLNFFDADQFADSEKFSLPLSDSQSLQVLITEEVRLAYPLPLSRDYIVLRGPVTWENFCYCMDQCFLRKIADAPFVSRYDHAA